MTTALAVIASLIPCLGHADLIAHYNFDTVTESGGVFTTDEVTSSGTNFATAGVRAEFIQSCRRLGTGSLLLENRPGSDQAGSLDGALSNNTFDWTSAFNQAGEFVVTVENLVPGQEYDFIRTTNLEDFDYELGSAFLVQGFSSTASTRVLIDPAPPAGRAFYRVQEYNN